MIVDDLKDIILGYRKVKGKTQEELAEELGVPKDVISAIECGTFKHLNPSLKKKIDELLKGYDKSELAAIGRGYRLQDNLGPDFKYYLEGLSKKEGIKTEELKKMPELELYKFIGKTPYDYVELIFEGAKSAT